MGPRSRSRECTDLGEQRVKAVDFLALFDKGIILGYPKEREFLHEIDLMRLAHMFVLERSQ
jgi:hypothetical protein